IGARGPAARRRTVHPAAALRGSHSGRPHRNVAGRSARGRRRGSPGRGCGVSWPTPIAGAPFGWLGLTYPAIFLLLSRATRGLCARHIAALLGRGAPRPLGPRDGAPRVSSGTGPRRAAGANTHSDLPGELRPDTGPLAPARGPSTALVGETAARRTPAR